MSEIQAEAGTEEIDILKLLSKEDKQHIYDVFAKLVEELAEFPEFKDMPETNSWLTRVLHYNVPHGKMSRGMTTILAYRLFTANSELDKGNVHLSYVLGWAVEMLQASLLMADDIMDGSETRRGRPCWYKVKDVGTGAVNDAFLVEGAIYRVLKKYFRHKDYYVDLVELLLEGGYRTQYGQCLDTRTALDKNMETYTMEKWSAIVKYKTSYYSFYLPVALAMTMAGLKDEDVMRQVDMLSLEMGHYFQVRDDFFDCYGDASVTGKIGTDIQACKCSWLFVTAMERANSEQKLILLDNYGQDDEMKVNKVKELYTELNLPKLYQTHEKETSETISAQIQMLPKLLKVLFNGMFHKIYQRLG